MPLSALIFDFDGMLVDTETPDFTVLAEQYRAHGCELLAERWLAGLGTYGGYDPYAELEELAGRALDREALARAHRQRYLEICEAQGLRPGVAGLIAAAHEAGLALAVASSASRDWVEGWLPRHGLRERFTCVRTRDDVQRVKPAPDLFLSAAACLGVPPSECVVFEDSPNGLRAAAAAGMRCVAVTIDLLAHIELPPHTLRLRALTEVEPRELLARLA
ncbi:MAG TPA: HAD family hydrolase [Roseiflexaceae bacterium]|nr:HAD family hydrolase [Roseiflexaceae bacterium]